MSTRLVKGGIEVTDWNEETQSRETTIERPDNVADLLGFWYHNFDIADDYTMGDLVELLDGVEGIEILNPMFQTDIRAFLDEAKKPAVIDPTCNIRFLEVATRAELTEYKEDPDNPDEPFDSTDDPEEFERLDAEENAIADITGEEKGMTIIDATGDDMFGNPVLRRLKGGSMNGKWHAPYRTFLVFHGRGKYDEPYEGAWDPDKIDEAPYKPGYEGSWSVSMSPINEILHLPLKKNEHVVFMDNYPMGEAILDTSVLMLLGDFIHAVFWYLGFYGTPEKRDETKEVINERHRRLKDSLEQGDGSGE